MQLHGMRGISQTHRRSWTQVAVNEHVGYLGRERREPEKPRPRRRGCGVGWSAKSEDRGEEGGEQRSCSEKLEMLPAPHPVPRHPREGAGGRGAGRRRQSTHGRLCVRPVAGRQLPRSPPPRIHWPLTGSPPGRLGKGKGEGITVSLPASSLTQEQSQVNSLLIPSAIIYPPGWEPQAPSAAAVLAAGCKHRLEQDPPSPFSHPREKAPHWRTER
ncbi:uncharacterized protein [Notamacropus eugenii]|uniref:uncharacterized protein n=1 Tax=Notamacropus eugenii TaxID=9315 RepID=UPI003B67E0C8